MRLSLVFFVVGLGVFSAFAGSRLGIHSADNHFVYQADAFLDGSAELTRKPPHQNDWASFEVMTLRGATAETHGAEVRGFFTRRKGKPNEFRLLDGRNITVPVRDRGDRTKHYFVSFPPAPAVLMMPLVALTGYGTNDVVFTVFFAALNVALAFVLLGYLQRAGYTSRSRAENVWLTVLFGFGTAHLWCAVLGRVWFTALIVGVTFHLLYLLFALDTKRPFLAGLCLAVAFSTRASLVVAALFFYLQLIWPGDKSLSAAERLRRFAWFSAPCLVVGISLLVFNDVRFGDPLEFGHTYLAGGSLPRIRDHGLFSSYFLERNLTAAFTLVPKLTDAAPYVQFSKHGMSIFLSTPALVLLVWPKSRSRMAKLLAVTALAVAAPIFFYQNTGWEQFGYRFSLDFMPYLLALLALGGRRINRFVKALVIAGILVNAVGAATFQRAPSAKLYADFINAEPRN
jgi:hypothetical protein